VKRSTLLTGALGLAVASPLARRADAQALKNVRLGTSAIDLFAQPFFVRDAGFFKKAGLDVDIKAFGSVPPIAAAVAGGDLDIGVAVPISLANAVIRGVPLIMIAGGALDTAVAPISQLCVAHNSPIRVAKDFEGKSIAVSGVKALSDLSLDVWLTQRGADPAKVGRLEMVQAAMTAAIVRGAVAGALLAEPQLSAGRKSDGVVALGDPFMAIAPRVLMSCWFTTTAFAEKNPDVIHRFQSAFRDGSRWANQHHAESAAILANYTQIDNDLLKVMGRCAYAERLQAADLQPELDVAAKYGITPKAVMAGDLFLA
jgi:NitT/TauT family transport system substrate-binding protein